MDSNILPKCRICLQPNYEMNSLFEPFYNGYSLEEIFRNISSIQIAKYDEVHNCVPNSICPICTRVIITFHCLMENFKESEKYFSEVILNKKDEPLLDHLNENQSGIESNDDNIDNDHYPGNQDIMDEDSYSLQDIGNENNGTCEKVSNLNNEPNEVERDKLIKEGQCYEPDKNQSLNETSTLKEEHEEIVAVKYSCEVCGDCFLFKAGFSHHMLMVHNVCIQVNQYEQYSSSITIKVPKADKEVKSFRKSNPSTSLLAQKSDVKCNKCKKTFLTPCELKIHYEIHKTFRCDVCGAAFIKNSYLRDHLLKHSTDKCYTCKICGQAFKYRSALAIHRRDHMTTKRGFMCETCGKSFKERGTLKTHIKLKHTNERNFLCAECNLTFKLKAARDKHFVRKHTNNRTKDFICSMCGMAYLNKETLTRHMTDKHSDISQSHWCTVCEKSFTMKSNLLKHLRNKHNVITKNNLH